MRARRLTTATSRFWMLVAGPVQPWFRSKNGWRICRLSRASWMDWCQQRDLAPILGTLAWAPVGSYLQRRFGFAAVCGPRLAMIDGRFIGLVERHFDEYDKRDFVLRFADENRLAHDHCAAIGDSRSDAPLFMSVGFSIAFNASRELQSVASASTTSDDLLEILPLLEGWQTSL